jgi:hypothetical protein
MKIYILAINDLHNVGYNCKDVEVFTKKEDATRRMRELYLNAFKECYGDSDADPFEENVMDYQYTKDFSYIFGEYYFDIFEKEV